MPAWARPIHGGAASGAVPAAGLQVSITFPANSPMVTGGFVSGTGPFVYEFATATRQTGDYIGPSWTQQNWLSEVSGCPMRVYFRPDAAATRREIVLEYGKCWGAANAAATHMYPVGTVSFTTYDAGTGHITLTVLSSTGIAMGDSATLANLHCHDGSGNPVDINGTYTVVSSSSGTPTSTIVLAGPASQPVATIDTTNYGPTVSTVAHPLHTYTAVIEDNTGTLHTEVVAVPHWWWGRWRIGADTQTGTWTVGKHRPVINNPTTIMNNGWWPKMSTAGLPALNSYQPSVGDATGPCVYTVLGNAGVQFGMSTTGERWDIGLTSEPMARWMLNPSGTDGTVTYENAMFAWAEANGSIGGAYRDENTGACVNSVTLPLVNAYGTNGSPSGAYYFRASSYVNNSYVPSGIWDLSDQHFPALSNLPFLATFDGYYLENQHFNAEAQLCLTQYENASLTPNATAYIQLGSQRAYSWTLRDVVCSWFFATLAEANGALPSWILPSSTWLTLLRFNNYIVDSSYMTGTSPTPNPAQLFGSAHRMGTTEFWQQDMLSTVYGLALLYGVPSGGPWSAPSADTMYDFTLQNTLFRSNGTSGWPVANCAPYYTNQDIQGQNILLPADISGFAGDSYITSAANLWTKYQNENVATFTGSIAGTVLTVTAVAGGVIGQNYYPCNVDDASASLSPGTQITGQLTGATGGVGTYSVNISQTKTSRALAAEIGFQVHVPQYWAIQADPFNGGVFAEDGSNNDFLLYVRSALAIGKKLGKIYATPLGYVDTMVTGRNYMVGRHAYASA